jgi:hypothetical protein
MFIITNIENNNSFTKLSEHTEFEDVCNGRLGAVLNEDNSLVRTTTKYKLGNQPFNDNHYEVINKIKKKMKGLNIQFNNAMLEIYDGKYRKMGFHTDQSQDLVKNSYICLFSCYDDPNADLRSLVIMNKTTGLSSEITLSHNSIVVFSTHTNHNHLHKIILNAQNSKNKWLGMTLRLSKTFVKFHKDIPYLYPREVILRLANNSECREIYKHKGNENKLIDYDWPDLDYTLSTSDLFNGSL